MVKNYFTIALRNLLKRKMYSFINIAGLSLGVAVCLMILKYIDFELRYDKHHLNAPSIYRATSAYYQNGEYRSTGVISGFALGPSLLADEPEVKTYIRTHPMYGGAVVTYKRENGDPTLFHEEQIQFVDSTFFQVFTYKANEGDLNTALQKPNSIVLTQKMADKYFKKGEDPLGKILQVSGGWSDGDYEVTAVLDTPPESTHFSFGFLIPIHNLLRNGQYTQDNGWGWNNFVTYIQLHPNASVEALTAKMPAFVDKYRGKDLQDNNGKLEYIFQPILNIHLHPGLEFESSETVSLNTVYFFAIISIFILSIAWINYINLSTARALERAREVGIKKAVGAFRSQLISQFLFESILVNFIGVVLAILIALLLLPVLSGIVGKELTFDFTDYRLWLVLTGLFLFGSLVSGAYPAFVLSGFRTTEVLKGKAGSGTGGFSLRKALVVFQFASSLILIAGTFAIYRQVVYMRNADKGLTMDQMLIVNGPSVIDQKTIKQRLISLKDEMKKIPGVLSVATSAAIPGGGHNWGTSMRRAGETADQDKNGRIVWIDPDFIQSYGITVLSGRSFDPSIKSDMEAVLVNEAALKAFGLGDPEHALQEQILLGGDTVSILGVLKNYHWTSLQTEHTPWLFKADTISRRYYSVHIESKNMPETISKIEAQYKEAFPGNPFDYNFLDDFFNTQYKSEQQFAKIFGLFAILAIVIACLGLWGLASFTTTQKLKEIGIRKVLGASVRSIMSLLSWQFFKLLLIASILALPLAWYGINSWLGGFAFKIGLAWDLFVVPVAILILLALGTVSIQIFRGANINPAKTLRNE